jgi:ATP-binding cassette subfamily B multidrug efflux pump
LVLRLNNMTYWIMWAFTSLVQQLGVVQEGMETITQPIGLVDKPGATPLKLSAGKVEIDHVSHHYGRGFGGWIRCRLPSGRASASALSVGRARASPRS